MLKDLKGYTKAVPMSIDEVICYCNNKIEFPPFTYAITFDDGFENNYTIAAPILVDFNLPATFYITTDFIDNDEMSWTDQLEEAFERTEKKELKLLWDVNFDIDTVDKKILALEELRGMIKGHRWPLGINKATEMALGGLFGDSILGYIPYRDKQLDNKMNWSQVKELNSNTLFTIGGHTVTHSILSREDEEGLKFEIGDGCIEYINMKLNQKTIHFSYPEGLKEHYNDKAITVLKGAGIKCCPTAICGVNINEDLFNLKRIMVI